MIDRREVLKWGALASLLAGTEGVALAGAPAGLDAVVLDGRYPVAGSLVPEAPRTFRVDGDVTALWYDTLDPLWRQPGFVLGGVTGGDVLFVLATLARDRGRRVVSRRPLPAADGAGPVAWIIAPVHPSVRA